jgi:isopentenyl phosphate kinase
MNQPSSQEAAGPTFLKLGGSLITDKTRPETVRADILRRLAQEVSQALGEAPGLCLVLGHGSGSFGHMAARQHGTRDGVHDAPGWLGFAQVADAAARLNRVVVGAFLDAGLPVWAVQPSAAGWCSDGLISHWPGEILEMALARGLVPLIYGDTLLDTRRGGTIASTEELFAWLVARLRPTSIVLVGTVDGVYSADPMVDPQAEPWPRITPQDLPQLQSSLGGSHGVDVTGGMLSKVTEMCQLVQSHPGLRVRLISGLREGAVRAALLNDRQSGGTLICSR